MTDNLTGDLTRIAIVGAAGRMGRHLVMACSESENVQLTQALEKPEGPLMGSDAGNIAAVSYTHLTLPTIYSV